MIKIIAFIIISIYAMILQLGDFELKPRYKKFFNLSFVIIVLFGLFLLIFEYFNYDNFIYIKYGLSVIQIRNLIIFLFLFNYINNNFNLNFLIFFAPIIYLIIILNWRLVNANLFFKLTSEDNLIEYAQFLILITSCILCYLIQKKLNKYRVYKFLFILGIIFFLFLAGEEISWGQRWFNIETPQHIAKNNLQNEINIHNQSNVFGYVYRGYILIGLYGSISWILDHYMKIINNIKQIHKQIFIINPFLFFYFAITCVYFYLKFILRIRIDEFEESIELPLLSGILFHLLDIKKYLWNDNKRL